MFTYLIQFRGSFSQSMTQRNLSHDIHPTGNIEKKKKITDWSNRQQELMIKGDQSDRHRLQPMKVVCNCFQHFQAPLIYG